MFKKGDKIVCVNNDAGAYPFTVDNIYQVDDVHESNAGLQLRVKNDNDRYYYYPHKYFTLHTPKQTDMIPENCEAFDLDAALDSPSRIITRDGRQVKLADYNENAEAHQRIAGWIGGELMGWHSDGIYSKCSRGPEDLDLFLRAVEVKVYECVSPNLRSMVPYTTLEGAIANSGPLSAAVVELTYRANQLVDVKIAHRF